MTNDVVHLRLFSFSLRDNVKIWLNSLALGAITTWEELVQRFLAKYFSPTKTAKLRNDITIFIQWKNESLHETWVCYKDLLEKCPRYDYLAWLYIQTFYNRLGITNKSMVNAATTREALMNKTHDQCMNF